MKNSFASFLSLLFFCLPLSISAQIEYGLQLQYNQQLGALANAGLMNGWGLSSEIISSPFVNRGSPIMIQVGLRWDYASTGQENTGLTFQNRYDQAQAIEVSNDNAGIYGLIRFSTQTRNTQWYLDGLLGGRGFYSTEGEGMEVQRYEPETICLSVTPSWGASFGVLLHVSKIVALDFHGTYLQGNSVSFVDFESVQPISASQYRYDTRSARASQLMLNAGINILMTKRYDRVLVRL